MKMLKSSMMVLTLCLGTMAVPALAAAPTDGSLRQLITVTKVDKMAKQMMMPDSSMTDQIIQAALTGIPQDEISEYQREQLGKIISKYNREMFSDDYINALNKQLIEGYIKTAKRHFTQQEVNAQIEFYGSKLGQSIINKQPAMMQDYMNEVMPAVTQSSMAELQKVMPRMQAEIEALDLQD